MHPHCELNIIYAILLMYVFYYFINWSGSSSFQLQLYYPDPDFYVATYYETNMMLYCAWNSFSELGRAHYKYIIIIEVFEEEKCRVCFRK